jgi:casein kinase II subunit beta
MQRDRGVSATAGGAGERKRIGDAMDRSSPSTSWGFSGGRERDRIAAGKQPEVPRSGGGSTAMSKGKLSDGKLCPAPFSLLLLAACFSYDTWFLGPTSP